MKRIQSLIMDKIKMTSFLIVFALLSRVESQTPQSTPQNQFQSNVGTPAPFSPQGQFAFGFPGTLRPQNPASLPQNPIFGAFPATGLLANGQPFLPVFGRPPQQLKFSNIFPSSTGFPGILVNGEPLQGFTNGVFSPGAILPSNPQINADQSPVGLKSPINGNPQEFSFLPPRSSINENKDTAAFTPESSPDEIIPTIDNFAPATNQNPSQDNIETSTLASPGAVLTTAAPLPSPPIISSTTDTPFSLVQTIEISSDLINESDSPSTLVPIDGTKRIEEIKASDSNSNRLSLASRIEQLKSELINSETKESKLGNQNDNESINSDTTQISMLESRTIENEPLLIIDDGQATENSGLNDGQATENSGLNDGQATENFGLNDGQATENSGLNDGQATENSGLNDGQATENFGLNDGQKGSDLLVSRPINAPELSNLDISFRFEEPKAEDFEESSNIKENTISGDASNSGDESTNKIENQDATTIAPPTSKIMFSTVHMTTEASSTPKPTTTESISTPESKNPLRRRNRNRSRPSSRAQLLERLKKLRERRLSTTRPQRPTSIDEKSANNPSDIRNAIRNRRLNNRRRPNQKRPGEDFNTRLRNRLLTTRPPKEQETSSSPDTKTDSSILDRPITERTLSFRERLNRSRANNRSLPPHLRRLTPRTTTSIPITISSAITEEINTEEIENETIQTVPTIMSSTENTSDSKMQEIRNRITVMLSQKQSTETPTTEEVLALLEDVTEMPMLIELLQFPVPSSEHSSNITSTNNADSIQTMIKDKEKTKEIPLDDLLTTIVDSFVTSEKTPPSFFSSSLITGPTTLTTPETVSFSLTSTHFSNPPESVSVDNLTEATTSPTKSSFQLSIENLKESLHSGKTNFEKQPVSNTEVVQTMKPITSESVQTKESVSQTFSTFKPRTESKIDDSSIQDFIASLIARGIITEAKATESSVSVPQSTIVPDETEISTETTASTSDITTDIPTVSDIFGDISPTSTSLHSNDQPLLDRNPSLTNANSNPIISSDGRGEILTPIKTFATTNGFIPSDPLVSRVRMMDTTEKFTEELNDSPTETSLPTESSLNFTPTFEQHPFEVPSVFDSSNTFQSTDLELEESTIDNSNSIDHLNNLLKSFGSSSIRPELSAMTRVLGLSLLNSSNKKEDDIDVNIEEPELLNDYQNYDYDLEPAATEQVTFITRLDTTPFETQTSVAEELNTEGSPDTNAVTAVEDLIPTILNMDVNSFTVSEPSVTIQNISEKTLSNKTINNQNNVINTIINLDQSNQNTIAMNNLSDPVISDTFLNATEVNTTSIDDTDPESSLQIIEVKGEDTLVTPEIIEITTVMSTITSQDEIEDAIPQNKPIDVNTAEFISQDNQFQNDTLDATESSSDLQEILTDEPLPLQNAITTIEPLVVSASDTITQKSLTKEITLDQNIPFTNLQQDGDQIESVILTKDTNNHETIQGDNADSSIDVMTPLEKEFHIINTNDGNISSNSSNSASGAIPKAIGSKRPDLLLLSKDRENTEIKENDGLIAAERRGNSVPFERTRNPPKFTSPQASRGRVSLSQLLSQRTSPGSSIKHPVEGTEANSAGRFSSHNSPTKDNSSENSSFTPGIVLNSGVDSFNPGTISVSQLEKIDTKVNTTGNIASSLHVETSSANPSLKETDQPNNKQSQTSESPDVVTGESEKEKFLKFLALNRQKIASLKNVRKGINASSPDNAVGFHNNTTETITTMNTFRENQTQPTTLLRPIPQARFFNLSTVHTLSTGSKQTTDRKSSSQSRKDPPHFLVPSHRRKNSSQSHNLNHHNVPSKFSPSNIVRGSIRDSNFPLPLIPQSTKQQTDGTTESNKSQSESSLSFLIPLATEPTMSATTKTPVQVLQQTTENMKEAGHSRQNRIKHFSTTPRPSRGSFTTLASLLEAKNQSPSRTGITTPKPEHTVQAFREFTTQRGDEKLVTFTPVTVLPDIEESSTHLGPLSTDPFTSLPEDLDTTFPPQFDDRFTTNSEFDESTQRILGNEFTFEAGKTAISSTDIPTTTQFKPSNFFNKQKMLTTPTSRFDHNLSSKTQGFITPRPTIRTTSRGRLAQQSTTPVNFKDNAFETSATTFNPQSFFETTTASPSSFGFDVETSTISSFINEENDQSSTGRPIPTTFIDHENAFFSEDEPPATTIENDNSEFTTVTETNSISTIPTFTVTPKIILLALPVVNTTSIQELADTATNFINSKQDPTVVNAQPVRVIENNGNSQREIESLRTSPHQNTELRDIFLASLPSGARPQQKNTNAPSVSSTTLKPFPSLQHTITRGVSIKAEKGIIQRNQLSPQKETNSVENKANFAAGGFLTTTPPPVPVTTQVINSGSFDNDPDNDHIPGQGGVDYPILDFIPETSFQCTKPLSEQGKMYADPETACQVYHVCNGHQKFSFLCPRGTIFHQETVVCQWWYTVDCLAQARKLAQIQALVTS